MTCSQIKMTPSALDSNFPHSAWPYLVNIYSISIEVYTLYRPTCIEHYINASTLMQREFFYILFCRDFSCCDFVSYLCLSRRVYVMHNLWNVYCVYVVWKRERELITPREHSLNKQWQLHKLDVPKQRNMKLPVPKICCIWSEIYVTIHLNKFI